MLYLDMADAARNPPSRSQSTALLTTRCLGCADRRGLCSCVWGCPLAGSARVNVVVGGVASDRSGLRQAACKGQVLPGGGPTAPVFRRVPLLGGRPVVRLYCARLRFPPLELRHELFRRRAQEPDDVLVRNSRREGHCQVRQRGGLPVEPLDTESTESFRGASLRLGGAEAFDRRVSGRTCASVSVASAAVLALSVLRRQPQPMLPPVASRVRKWQASSSGPAATSTAHASWRHRSRGALVGAALRNLARPEPLRWPP